MDNSNKTILDLCGGTGAWSYPYRKAGYDVRLITLHEFDVLDYMPPKNVYGILAAPPCTMFSIARTQAKTPRDFKEGMLAVRACMGIIWSVREEQKLKFWALENPRGILRQFLGLPVITFDPCDYGDLYTKKTDLWGYFKTPKKKTIKLTEEAKEDNRRHTRKLPGIQNMNCGNSGNLAVQTARRAITPPGFANAFFKANR